MSQTALIPKPSCCAVVFTSERTEGDEGCADIAVRIWNASFLSIKGKTNDYFFT